MGLAEQIGLGGLSLRECGRAHEIGERNVAPLIAPAATFRSVSEPTWPSEVGRWRVCHMLTERNRRVAGPRGLVMYQGEASVCYQGCGAVPAVLPTLAGS
jgi:hypothetical protein